MKIYAKQVPPEYRESPLFMEEWPENVFVFGNRDFTDRSGRLEDIRRGLEDIAEEYERLQAGYYQNYSFSEILNDYLPRDDKRDYTRPERLRLREIAFDYTYTLDYRKEKETLCAVLELVTGRKYDYATIRGCCQGDWQEIIYPCAYGREWLDRFETEYFNIGEEWRISENDPENDENYYFYTHAWNNDGIREEIAAAAGVEPGDVILYTFTGCIKEAEYTEAS